ncbi:DUF4268 domain-containing protein [Chloroflexota bacterium]
MSKGAVAETKAGSLVEQFHLVRSLVPESQQVVTAPPDMRVGDAIELMNEHKFSQLPVVAGKAVLGVFSYRSFALRLLGMRQEAEGFGELPVDEFLDQFQSVQPQDNWESILEHLDREDGVLVGHSERLDGIVTPMDVLTYLHEIASPFVMLAEIELSLRRIIDACVSQSELRDCLSNSLGHKYSPEEMPGRPEEMTFNDYVQIIGDGRNWPHFTTVFGSGDWQRKTTTARLKEVGALRNDVFHFRRDITARDRDLLGRRRKWLRMKARAFEARKAEKASLPDKQPPAPAVKQQAPGTVHKWDESSFFERITADRGDAEATVARQILAWAEPRVTRVYWGEGKRVGAFVPILNHSGTDHQLFAVRTRGEVEMYFQYYRRKDPFKSKERRRELADRLNAIDGVSLPADAINRRPSIPLSVFARSSARDDFFRTMDWVIAEIQSSHETPSERAYRALWADLLPRFKDERPHVTRRNATDDSWLPLPIGITNAHIEWAVHGLNKPDGWFEVGLHLEHRDRDINLAALNWLSQQQPRLAELVGEVLTFEEWGKRWARVFARREAPQINKEVKDWALQTTLRWYDALEELDIVGNLRRLGW